VRNVERCAAVRETGPSKQDYKYNKSAQAAALIKAIHIFHNPNGHREHIEMLKVQKYIF
jgi:hypothetical protein